MSDLVTHLDEYGRVCTRHPAPSSSEILSLAVVGSRAPSFHHDLASKLQGLMMAIDEISEVAEDSPPPLARALETAHTTLREVLQLLNANRALTKAPTKTRATLAELTARASERVYVSLRGDIVVASLEGAVPALIHALALVLDVAGGPGRGRVVEAKTAIDERSVVMTISIMGDPPPTMSEALALAAFVFAREGGELRCAGEGTRLVVRLPVL